MEKGMEDVDYYDVCGDVLPMVGQQRYNFELWCDEMGDLCDKIIDLQKHVTKLTLEIDYSLSNHPYWYGDFCLVYNDRANERASWCYFNTEEEVINRFRMLDK